MTTFDFYYFADQIIKEYVHQGTQDMKLDLDIKGGELVMTFYLFDESNQIKERHSFSEGNNLDETYDTIDNILAIIGGVHHE